MTLITVGSGPDREKWIGLLELADEPVPLRNDAQQGELYGLRDDHSRPRAAVLVIARSDSSAELRAVAVAESDQGRGIGTRIVTEVLDRLHAAGIGRVVVGTASSGLRQLGFYQRLGFRLSHIERDFFVTERGYPADLCENGIRTRDMVWMDKPL